MDFKKSIINVKDFPKKGINFKDITPILTNPELFKSVIDCFSKQVIAAKANVIVSPEARGFLFASAVAYKTGAKFVIARKPGKLPRETKSISFTYEYNQTTLEIHKDALNANDVVYIIDDVLASGETSLALIKLVETFNAKVSGLSFLLEIEGLNGIDKLANYNCNILDK